MTSAFDAYGSIADEPGSFTELAGRLALQREAEARIPADVQSKLMLDAADRLLEIGCGAGNLLLPLSERVASATGIDHAALLKRLGCRDGGDRILALPGDFLECAVPGRYSKVLVYSVLHCLPDHDAVSRFIDRALDCLESGGAALFGDIPNDDLKARFVASDAGAAFEAEWQARLKAHAAPSPAHTRLAEQVAGLPRACFDDTVLGDLVKRLRQRGLNAYWLPQHPDLPFGRTREDLLVLKP